MDRLVLFIQNRGYPWSIKIDGNKGVVTYKPGIYIPSNIPQLYGSVCLMVCYILLPVSDT